MSGAPHLRSPYLSTHGTCHPSPWKRPPVLGPVCVSMPYTLASYFTWAYLLLKQLQQQALEEYLYIYSVHWILDSLG